MHVKLSKQNLKKIQIKQLKESLISETTKISRLMKIIRSHSTLHRNEVLEFMHEYHLDNLQSVKVNQLEGYIARHKLSQPDKGKGL